MQLLFNNIISTLDSWVTVANGYLWSYILIALLVSSGLFFSIRTGFVQFRLFTEMFRLLTEGVGKSINGETNEHSVSSFQAFCISTASRVGTGNLAGVAIAIAIGGPGAVFWMWVIALIGGASSFVESTLAQIYKVKDGNVYRGGPAYYMEKALNARWMGLLFSILITICFGLVFNSVQANTISQAFNQAFGIDTMIIAIALSILTGFVIFGGVNRIVKVSEMIVPIMATAYVAVALFIVAKNITLIPEVIALIFKSAFGIGPVVGGGVASAMMMGIKRGLFSNEAGMGSAPNAAATAEVTHPAKQGLIQTLGVFTDTILICSATAFIILISGVYTDTKASGIQLTQNALTSQIGSFGNTFVALCILLFAFSSIVGNYYYGETNIEFMNTNKWLVRLYRVAVVLMVFFGCISSMTFVWNLADLFMGLMAILNIIAILLLGPIAFDALKDYTNQKKQGKDPVFDIKNFPHIKNTTCWNVPSSVDIQVSKEKNIS